jgi:hemin uptake protein HemP
MVTMMTKEKPDERPTIPSISQARVLTSAELLKGNKEVLIEHQGQIYRLRLTRSGKLLLHK